MINPRNTAILFGNRILDAVLSVDTNAVLNDGKTTGRTENPAQAMMKASKELLASGLDVESGRVDYAELRDSAAYADFRRISYSLSDCKPDDIGNGDQAKTFWINLYNALIVDGIIHHQMNGSIMRWPGFFRQVAYDIGGMRFSADAIEHGVLRHNRAHPALPLPVFTSTDPRSRIFQQGFDPRIHFALVCGANSCPPIAFYETDKLQQQLELASGAFINGSGVRSDHETGTLWLSRIFRWYAGDFGGRQGVLDIIRRHLNDSDLIAIINSRKFRIRYMPYDWSINRLA